MKKATKRQSKKKPVRVAQGITTLGGLLTEQARLYRQARRGEITPSSAHKLMSMLVAIRQSIEKDRPRSLNFKAPVLTDAQSVLTALSATIEAMAKGRITADEAKSVSGLLSDFRRVYGDVELEERLREVERRLEK